MKLDQTTMSSEIKWWNMLLILILKPNGFIVESSVKYYTTHNPPIRERQIDRFCII